MGAGGRAVKYMITFNHVDGVWDALSAEQKEEHGKWLGQFAAALKTEKDTSLVFLGFPEQRKTVRMDEDGTVAVHDGPYLEANEQIGGYYIIDAESMDEAVEWAKKGRFMTGSNEVRPILSPPA
jgi:hypothetical protein